ncbi:MAG: hypothetical protein R2813_01625 [Flavobacteriales bacterium]
MTNLHLTMALTFLILFSTVGASAQSRKRLRELEKMEKSHEEEADADNSEAIERHLSIQTKKTRKEMKRYKKLSKQYNNNKRPLFSKGRRRRR